MRKFLLIPAMALATWFGSDRAALGQANNVKDLPSALEYLKSDKSTDRAFALSVMGLLGGDAVTASRQVVQSYFDSSPEVRRAASLALQNVNPSLYAPVQALTAANDPANPNQYGTQLQAIQALANLGAAGNAALPALVAFIPRMAPADQVKMVAAVAKVGENDPEVRQLLSNWALTSTNPAVRKEAMKLLPKVQGSAAEIRVFMAALEREKDPKRQIELIGGLALIGRGDRQVTIAIQRYATNANPDVQKAAKAALKDLQGKAKN